jgi:uncharacterized membrane protein YkoI
MRLIALVLAAVLATAGLAVAGSADQERARAAMEAGETMPLADILAKVDKQFAGRVIEVKLTDLDQGLPGWVYAITLLSPQDNVLSLKVDAGTGVILKVEGHGIEEARKAQ